MKDLWVLKTLTISPIEMLVRRGRNPYVGISTHQTQETMRNVSGYLPQSDTVHSWETATGLPWDPIDCCAVHTRRELACPKCGVIVVARWFAHRFDSVAWFSTFWVHSLPYAREDRFSTRSLHFRLWHLSVCRHEREPCGFQVCERSHQGSQEPRRREPVQGRGLPSVSTALFVVRVIDYQC